MSTQEPISSSVVICEKKDGGLAVAVPKEIPDSIALILGTVATHPQPCVRGDEKGKGWVEGVLHHVPPHAAQQIRERLRSVVGNPAL